MIARELLEAASGIEACNGESKLFWLLSKGLLSKGCYQKAFLDGEQNDINHGTPAPGEG
jgi:hypothetical protein